MIISRKNIKYRTCAPSSSKPPLSDAAFRAILAAERQLRKQPVKLFNETAYWRQGQNRAHRNIRAARAVQQLACLLNGQKDGIAIECAIAHDLTRQRILRVVFVDHEKAAGAGDAMHLADELRPPFGRNVVKHAD